MVTKNNSKKNKKTRKTSLARKRVIKSKDNLNRVFKIRGIVERINTFLFAIIKFVIRAFRDLVKAPFLFINIFYSTIFLFIKKVFFYLTNFIKNIFSSFYKYREIFFGVLFGIISGGIGAILAVTYIELNSDATKMSEKLENLNYVNDQINTIEERIKNTEAELENTKSNIEILKDLKSEILASERKFKILENDIKNINMDLEKVSRETGKLGTNLSDLSRDLESNSKLILSSSKTELSNRLYLAQSLLDRLESGVPYSPQLKALGKEGLDPALLRFAAGGAPTLKDLEARLSARAGEQLDADRTKRDNTWRENLKREISKYVKIKPTNINDIKGVTGALLRAENSISKGNLAQAIDEISSVPVEERGPLDAWLAEAKARQNADIAAKNLLAKTTAALKQKN